MNNRLLISGGTGYVGSKIAAVLSDSGYEVVVLTRRLPPSRSPGVRYVIHDMTSRSIASALEDARAETVIHAAARYVRRHEAVDVGSMIEANFTIGVLMLEAAARIGVSRFLYTGSFFQHSGSPPHLPRNLYAALKNAFEEILNYYATVEQIDGVSLTLCDVYGEDDPRPRLFTAAIAAAINGSTLRISKQEAYLVPVHIDDVTAAVKAALAHPFANQTFWVGPDAAVKLSDVLATISSLTGAILRIERADLPGLPGDTLAPLPGVPIPGWSPSVSLEEGLLRMIKAYQANGEAKQ